MFEWKPEYSLGVAALDAEHRKLFGMAEELHAAMMAGQARPALAGLLEALLVYTGQHFADEERLMRLRDYPLRAAHKAEHDKLTRRAHAFREEFRAGRMAISVDLLSFLKDWLTKHIQGSDRQYAPYLADAVVR
jgi:hemerythrin